MDTALLLLAVLAPAAPDEPTHRLEVATPADDPAAVPDFYRRPAAFTVEWHLICCLTASGTDVSAVRFPNGRTA